jgi:hypothetical protein
MKVEGKSLRAPWRFILSGPLAVEVGGQDGYGTENEEQNSE